MVKNVFEHKQTWLILKKQKSGLKQKKMRCTRSFFDQLLSIYDQVQSITE